MKTNYTDLSNYLKFDNKGSVFIMDQKERRVYKYDNKGKYLTSFCNKGQGPGEISYANGVYVKNDTITVFDTARKVYNYFSTGGEFLNTGEEKIKGLIYSKDLGDKIAYSGYGFKKIDGLYNIEWGLYSRSKTGTDTLYKYNFIYEKGYNEPAMTVKFDTYKDRLCFLYPDPHSFKIEVFDENSNRITEINMYHRIIKNSIDEVKKINKYNSNTGRKLEAVGKLPASSISYDKYGNIWAERVFNYSESPEYKDRTVYDVFNPEGIYLNRIINDNNYDEPFVDDEYIEYDSEEEKFIIYDYEFS